MLQAAAAAAMTFNLVCTGTLTTETFYQGRQTEPYRYEYRIDLAQRKYCDGECRALRDIAEIQPTVIILEPNRDINTVTERQFHMESINRETGRHSILHTSGRREQIMIMSWAGQCERAPFSGFPTFQTRF